MGTRTASREAGHVPFGVRSYRKKRGGVTRRRISGTADGDMDKKGDMDLRYVSPFFDRVRSYRKKRGQPDGLDELEDRKWEPRFALSTPP